MRVAFFLTLLCAGLSLSAQPQLNNIATALGKGDVEGLSIYFDSKIDLVLPEQDGVYSKAQSTELLKAFFSTRVAAGCQILSSGTARDKGSQYSIGRLKAAGKGFRVTLFFKEIEGKHLIKGLRIEEE